MSFSSSADKAFVAMCAELASQPLSKLIESLTGEPATSAPEDMASFGMRGYTSGKYHPVRVSVAKLEEQLVQQNRSVSANDHNYRRRYGPEKGGDKEHWEALMKRNPAQVLPMLMVSHSDSFTSVTDAEGDAGYVQAVLRDNGWKTMVVAVPVDNMEDVKRRFGAECEKDLPNLNFILEYEDAFVEALEVLQPGKVLGTSMKFRSRPSMGMPRPVFEPRIRDVVIPRGNTWLHDGHTMTTEELLAFAAIPAVPLAVQVHYELVKAFMSREAPLKNVVPQSVWEVYQERDKQFAYLC